ncbi:MAG: hypothetical protein NTX03_02540 [Bacteroidetes bacterium]|nr:hypothetical protein [Bacteroidota bacterium]
MRYTYYLTFFVFIFLTFSCEKTTKYTISGRVLDGSTKLGLKNTSLKLFCFTGVKSSGNEWDLQGTTKTDSLGNFKISYDSRSNYTGTFITLEFPKDYYKADTFGPFDPIRIPFNQNVTNQIIYGSKTGYANIFLRPSKPINKGDTVFLRVQYHDTFFVYPFDSFVGKYKGTMPNLFRVIS